jgi:hypothetical protein
VRAGRGSPTPPESRTDRSPAFRARCSVRAGRGSPGPAGEAGALCLGLQHVMRPDGQAFGRGRESRPLPVLPVNRDMERALCTKEPYLNTGDPRPARSPAFRARRNVRAGRGSRTPPESRTERSPAFRARRSVRAGRAGRGSPTPPESRTERSPAFRARCGARAGRGSPTPPESRTDRSPAFRTRCGARWARVTRSPPERPARYAWVSNMS